MMHFQGNAQNAKHFEFARNLNIQHILTNPIMDIAARVWEDERYDAAKICYRSMRVVDDLIDTIKSGRYGLSEDEIQKLTATVNHWVEGINNSIPQDALQKQLIEIIKRFQIPLWPWRSFSNAMIYDIHHNGYRTFPVFLKYAEGATIAPASIFVHFCGVVNENGHYRAPDFDTRELARPAAVFCYLVHIIRDFQRDQNNNLNYFAHDLLSENGLTPQMLRDIAAGGSIPSGFRNLMKEYVKFAEYYRRKTRQQLDFFEGSFAPRYRLSLEIVYNLYLLSLERIDVTNGRFTTAELLPSPGEVKNRFDLTASNFQSTKR